MAKKVLIVGGVAGGASAAARLRRLDEKADIILFERGEHISFANCGLPYYIGGVIAKRDKLLVQTPEAMKARFNIDVRVNSEVTRILPGEKQVEVTEKGGYSYRESYDYLILSPGAAPVKPPVPGADAENIFTVRNIPDVDAIKEYIEKAQPQKVVVVGAGFIGLEMAENLKALGMDTTIVEMTDQVMPSLDYEMAALLHGHIRANGVKLALNDGVQSFGCDNNKANRVILKSGRVLPADLIIMAVGVRPETKLAQQAGLAIGPKGGIQVNERLQTSVPNIFAIGDAIEVKDIITGMETLVPLAGPANKQGRIVADVIAGRNSVYKGTQGTAIAKVFDLVAASTGASEKNLRKAGIPYRVSYTHSSSHASYYPGSTTMAVKLIFGPENGRLLGGQIVGCGGVDKRIDVLAAAIRRGDTVFDLQELELAYAPPFSSGKDPVNMAGYTAGNIMDGDVDVIHWHEIENLDRESAVLVDVRTSTEYGMGHIPGSLNIPVNEIRPRLEEIPRDKDVVIYCQIGLRGYIAGRILKQSGFSRVKNLSGGWRTYKPAIEEKEILKKGFDSKDDGYPGIILSEAAVTEFKDIDTANPSIKLDACGLQCPGPIIRVFQMMQNLQGGQVLEVRATDPGFLSDIQSWCDTTGNKLLKIEKQDRVIVACIRKIDRKPERTGKEELNNEGNREMDKQNTLVVFSGDLDKALASFIIANGAASMGQKVTMFFTFWGLNILRQDRYVPVKKGFMDRMFGLMMPRGSRKLQLSKMNMMGIGGRMIRMVMKQKNIDSLEELIAQARSLGVKLVACSMSLDVMGLKKEELIEGVEIGGVGTFLSSADKSKTTLFI